MKINEQNNIFLINYLRGFIKFRLGSYIEQIPKRLPLFLIAGKEDPVGNYGEGVEQVYHSFEKAQIRDVEMKLYEGMRHEILLEKDSQKVYDDVRLIIVDTFSDIDPNNKKATENDYQYTRGIIKNLQSLAKELDTSILIVYHDRKQFDTERPFANILGSTGIYSKVEGALVLHRNSEFGDSATLYQCGKSIPRAMYGTKFSETDFQWSDLQNVETMRNDDAAQAFNSDPIAKTVIRMLSECGGTKECRCTEIVNKAKEYGITITDSKKCIAQKLSIYKSKFSQYDNVDLTIINNGTGSRLYRFVDRNVDKDTSTV